MMEDFWSRVSTRSFYTTKPKPYPTAKQPPGRFRTSTGGGFFLFFLQSQKITETKSDHSMVYRTKRNGLPGFFLDLG